MAEPAREGASDATQGDWNEHAQTYKSFTHMTLVGVLTSVLVLVSLAIGGLGGAWWTAGFGILAGIVLALAAVNKPDITWRPFAALLAAVLVLYGLFGV